MLFFMSYPFAGSAVFICFAFWAYVCVVAGLFGRGSTALNWTAHLTALFVWLPLSLSQFGLQPFLLFLSFEISYWKQVLACARHISFSSGWSLVISSDLFANSHSSISSPGFPHEVAAWCNLSWSSYTEIATRIGLKIAKENFHVKRWWVTSECQVLGIDNRSWPSQKAFRDIWLATWENMGT